MIERLQSTEAGIETRLSDLARLWTLTMNGCRASRLRLKGARLTGGGSLSAVVDRLAALDHHWVGLERALQTMERNSQAREAQAHAAPRTAMERLAQVEAMVHGGLTRVAERLAALETTVSDRPDKAGAPQI